MVLRPSGTAAVDRRLESARGVARAQRTLGPDGSGYVTGMSWRPFVRGQPRAVRVRPLTQRVAAAYRRTGADLPGSDPRPTHSAEMEGWFWRFTDASSGRVVIALCGVNRHPDGPWATVAVSLHPGDVTRSGVFDGADASATSYAIEVPGVLVADERRLRVEVDDVLIDVRLDDLVGWPHRLGAGGIFSALPYLGQYWQPHVLGGCATGRVVHAGETWDVAGADVYAEKNWGAGFPDWWWWGQAQGFADPGLCVAFGGGRLSAGPLGAAVTGAIVRIGDAVVRFAPPVALVRASFDEGSWAVTARRPGWRMRITADGDGAKPAVLPVPLPAERRNVQRDFEHLAGRLHLEVWHRGRRVVDDTSPLAALEVGSTDPARAAALASEVGVAAADVD
jgi:tocopherol cyclase